MKFKLFFIFTLIFSSSPLCAMDQEKEDWNELLFQAVKKGDIEHVKECISKGADVNTHDTDSWTPLMVAAGKHFEIVHLLLENRANPNATTTSGNTSLMIASAYGHIKIIKLLLKYHARVNDKDKYGSTALADSMMFRKCSAVPVLLKHGADINFSFKKWENFGAADEEVGVTPLKYATQKKYFKTVELLLKYINYILDKTDDPETFYVWDQYILDALSNIETRGWTFPIKTINAFRMLLHHASKLPLSTKKLESVTAKTLGKRRSGEESFRKTVEHLRKHAF